MKQTLLRLTLLAMLAPAASLVLASCDPKSDCRRLTAHQQQHLNQQIILKAVSTSGGSNQNSNKYQLTESTKVVLVDESNESGLLWGTINNRGGNISAVTNFTVFLVSTQEAHIALLLDIEDASFEQILNCEHQELHFSVASDVTSAFLNRSNKNDDNETDGSTNNEGETHAVDGDDEDKTEFNKLDDDELGKPITSLGELLALAMNAPLNETILDADDKLDFRALAATMDWVRAETCVGTELEIHEHQQHLYRHQKQQQQQHHQHHQTSPLTRPKQMHHEKQLKKLPPSTTTTTTTTTRRPRNKQQVLTRFKASLGDDKDHLATNQRGNQKCRHQHTANGNFSAKLAVKLDEYYEWSDFKTICGKTRQPLLVPTRAVKIAAFGDEFAPAASFKIRYKFVRDSKSLPAADNNKYYCRNRRVVELTQKCDYVDDCGDASDESTRVCGYREPHTALDNELAKISLEKSDGTGRQKRKLETKKQQLVYVGADLAATCCYQQHTAASLLNRMTSTKPSKSVTQKRRIKRIVGGRAAKRGTWPAQASIQLESLEPLSHLCAGTLIHPQYVLTAGHCITRDFLQSGLKVVLGAHDLRKANDELHAQVQVRYVDDALVYPAVDGKFLVDDWKNDMRNDVALLRLNAPIRLTEWVAPACLPNTLSGRPPAVNSTCRAIGWGQTHGSGNSNLLKELEVRVVDSTLCLNKIYDDGASDYQDNHDKTRNSSPSALKKAKTAQIKADDDAGFDLDFPKFNPKTMLCVASDADAGICQGDSGGPLYCERKLGPTTGSTTRTGNTCTEMSGIASFILRFSTVGSICAVRNLPDVFGDVASKVEWIEASIAMFEQRYKLKYSQ